ncbi:hypothetical protein PAPYR_5305 [Paratrimastix pyriformis]|uniref:TLC domain-containing protein n=1 Tax=Paratrimastix pyriformis TaxID=342808 RepID=A0ABQ8UKP6_9EUKA|nr:hypothetical protein PAPYR_5305 [Paratrimastix pyriformis]
MDLSDCWLDLGKVLRDWNRKPSQALFLLFAVAFLALRLVVYPLVVLIPFFIAVTGCWEIKISMALLGVLNCVWMIFIIRATKRHFGGTAGTQKADKKPFQIIPCPALTN